MSFMKNDGMGFVPRQFERNTENPGSMRNLGLRELTETRGSQKQRARRSLRIMLPAWLSGRAIQAARKVEEETK